MAEIIETNPVNVQELIERELERARNEAKPISRRMLVSIVIKEAKLTPSEAELQVETYCDEKAAYTPEFLGKEFFLPYVKLAALLMSILSIIVLSVGADRWLNHQLNWPFFVCGAILFLVGGNGLLQAIKAERTED